MREFKFKAWHKKEKILGVVEFLDFEFQTLTLIRRDFYRYNIDLDNVSLMQYTGLKDKNGVEIYEGDIVEFWVDGCAKSRTAKVKFNTERGRWMLFATIGHHRDLTAEKASKCEIIGNIFENKELLK